MEMSKFTYLVIENAPDVCEGIIRRMAGFDKWQSLGYCVGVNESIKKICTEKPHLIYLDWGLNGGSAFEVLQVIQNIASYDPYIIFNTGFQKDNPEIPQEIVNRYKVDKYLIKPLWENLRINLPHYLAEAEEKVLAPLRKELFVWVEDNEKNKIKIDLNAIICILQNPAVPRCRDLYLINREKELTISLQWHKCYELLNAYGINYFVTKSRYHLVVKKYIDKFEKPFIRLQGVKAFKIDVAKESIKAFEAWLAK